MEDKWHFREPPINGIRLWLLKTFGGGYELGDDSWNYPGNLWNWFSRLGYKWTMFMTRLVIWVGVVGGRGFCAIIDFGSGSSVIFINDKKPIMGQMFRIVNGCYFVTEIYQLNRWKRFLRYLGFRIPEFKLTRQENDYPDLDKLRQRMWDIIGVPKERFGSNFKDETKNK